MKIETVFPLQEEWPFLCIRRCSLAVPPGLWYSLRVKSKINQLLNTRKNRYTDDEDKFGQGLKEGVTSYELL
jgi:hypothetical protein